MGTNYYGLQGGKRTHLGKLSAGWVPVVPHTDFVAWTEDVLVADGIVNEYGEYFTYEQIIGKFICHSIQFQFQSSYNVESIYNKSWRFDVGDDVWFLHQSGEFS